MKKSFAIIDIETTGGSPKQDKITEIGIVFHNGNEIIDSWQTLINPERSIPDYITRITGIDNMMVQDAPKFYEIARDLVELTEDCIFVAHNVRFDYGFIAEEFRQLGYTFSKKKLCTVQMSRRAFPELPSHSLGNLTRHFSIPLENHHRALADATATAHLFDLILKSDYYTRVNPINGRKSLKEQQLPASVSLDKLNNIPSRPGVYYFKDKDDKIIYIGKSKQLNKRIYDHFADQSERAARLQSAVHDIDYIITGNELAALLIESYDIKKYQPTFNKAQKKKAFKYVIAADKEVHDDLPVVVSLGKVNGQIIYRYYLRKKDAAASLRMVCHEVGLCPCALEQHDKDLCLQYKLQLCDPPKDQNDQKERIHTIHSLLRRGFDSNGFWVGPGRYPGESFVIGIKDLKFYGMGYIDNADNSASADELYDHIKPYPFNAEVSGIIKGYFRSHKDFRWVQV